MYGGQSTYIPLKVNQSGVVPIIFASSVLYLPLLITQVLPSDPGSWGVAVQEWVNDNLVQLDSFFYILVYGLLIIGFAYFYTAIAFDPPQQADTMRKQGGFIPGIRPAADRALPGQDPRPDHAAGRTVHRGHRPAAGDVPGQRAAVRAASRASPSAARPSS